MASVMIREALNTASCRAIIQHLALCSDRFTPALSKRVDISAYASKIMTHAECFEVWSEDSLAGLVAVYVNSATAQAFITNVSVLPAFGGQGIATALLRRCLWRLQQTGSTSATLEVGAADMAAIGLYKKLGFACASTDGARHHMTLNLQGWNP